MNIDLALTSNLAKTWAMIRSRTKPCRFHAVQAGAYDVVTGTATSVITTTDVRAFIFDHDLSLIGDGADIQVTDKRAIILAQHLPDIAGRSPNEGKAESGDRLTDHNGNLWNVLLVRGDPDFYFDLTLRR